LSRGRWKKPGARCSRHDHSAGSDLIDETGSRAYNNAVNIALNIRLEIHARMKRRADGRGATRALSDARSRLGCEDGRGTWVQYGAGVKRNDVCG